MNKEELVKAVAAVAKLSQKETAEIIGATIAGRFLICSKKGIIV